MRLHLWACLGLIAGCLSRTDVGALRPVREADAGPMTSPDSAILPVSEASLTAEERATRAFERELEGRWEGNMRSRMWGANFKTQLTFAADHACCIGSPPCTEGRFFVTDKLWNGKFAGKIEPSDGSPNWRLDEISLDESTVPETLRFTLSDSGFNVFEVNLTLAE